MVAIDPLDIIPACPSDNDSIADSGEREIPPRPVHTIELVNHDVEFSATSPTQGSTAPVDLPLESSEGMKVVGSDPSPRTLAVPSPGEVSHLVATSSPEEADSGAIEPPVVDREGDNRSSDFSSLQSEVFTASAAAIQRRRDQRSATAEESIPTARTDGRSRIKGPMVEYDILIENQRGIFLGKTPYFSANSLLNFDPKPWITGWTGGESITDVTNTTAPVGWHWTWDQWRVDMGTFVIDAGSDRSGRTVFFDGDVDRDGWQYAGWFGFSRMAHWFRVRKGKPDPSLIAGRNQEDDIRQVQSSFNRRKTKLVFRNTRWHGTHPFFHSFVRRRWWIRERQRDDCCLGVDEPEDELQILPGVALTPKKPSRLARMRSRKDNDSGDDNRRLSRYLYLRRQLPNRSDVADGRSIHLNRIPSVPMLIQLLRVKQTDQQRLDCLAGFLDIPADIAPPLSASDSVRDGTRSLTSRKSLDRPLIEPDGPTTAMHELMCMYYIEMVNLASSLPTVLRTFLMRESRSQALTMIRRAADTIRSSPPELEHTGGIPTRSVGGGDAGPSQGTTSSLLLATQDEQTQRKIVADVLTAAVAQEERTVGWRINGRAGSLGQLPGTDAD